MIERADAFDFIAIPESARRVIRFHWEDRLIHAPTAALIYQFREVLAAATPASPIWSSRCSPGSAMVNASCGYRGYKGAMHARCQFAMRAFDSLFAMLALCALLCAGALRGCPRCRGRRQCNGAGGAPPALPNIGAS